jgi:hypothetical protein
MAPARDLDGPGDHLFRTDKHTTCCVENLDEKEVKDKYGIVAEIVVSSRSLALLPSSSIDFVAVYS